VPNPAEPGLGRRRVPGTDLEVSEIGLGCYALSGVYGPADAEAFTATVREAYDLGVTLYDTADRYGSAEEVLGRAVAPFRDNVVIATKVGVTADGGSDTSAAHVKNSCEASLRRLGTDYIDLYQVHFNDPETPVAETVGALEDLRREGKIRYYGVGHLPVERVREYLEEGRVATLLLELSPLARQQYQAVRGLVGPDGPGLIGFSPTGRGLLTGKIGPDHEFAEGDIRRFDPLFYRATRESGHRVAAHLVDIGRRVGGTAAQVAIAWVLARPELVAALTGTTRIDHLRENVGAAALSLPDDILHEIEQMLDREDEQCRRAREKAVRGILSTPLPDETDRAFRDLVYVMEGLIELGLTSQERIIPHYMALLSSKRGTGGEAGGKTTDAGGKTADAGASDSGAERLMREIHAELAGILEGTA